MKSIAYTFETSLLKNFSEKDRIESLEIIFLYLLGKSKYSDTLKELHKFGIKYQFGKILRTFSDKKIEYIILLRKYAKYVRKGKNKKLKSVDKEWVNYLKSKNYSFKKIWINLPSQYIIETLYVDTTKKIGTLLYKKLNCNNDVKGIENLLLWKVIKIYRTYVYSLGARDSKTKKCFNRKVLDRCIKIGLRNSGIDYMRSIFRVNEFEKRSTKQEIDSCFNDNTNPVNFSNVELETKTYLFDWYISTKEGKYTLLFDGVYIKYKKKNKRKRIKITKCKIEKNRIYYKGRIYYLELINIKKEYLKFLTSKNQIIN